MYLEPWGWMESPSEELGEDKGPRTKPWGTETLRRWRDFPGGAVVKNPPANAGDMGSSPGPGRSHMPRSN